jgi:hypothetical protein
MCSLVRTFKREYQGGSVARPVQKSYAGEVERRGQHVAPERRRGAPEIWVEEVFCGQLPGNPLHWYRRRIPIGWGHIDNPIEGGGRAPLLQGLGCRCLKKSLCVSEYSTSFVSLTISVAVEARNGREVIDSGHVAILHIRLNGVAQIAAEEPFQRGRLEIPNQRRRPQLKAGLQIGSIDRGVCPAAASCCWESGSGCRRSRERPLPAAGSSHPGAEAARGGGRDRSAQPCRS